MDVPAPEAGFSESSRADGSGLNELCNLKGVELRPAEVPVLGGKAVSALDDPNGLLCGLLPPPKMLDPVLEEEAAVANGLALD
jgi:hypothetical protein